MSFSKKETAPQAPPVEAVEKTEESCKCRASGGYRTSRGVHPAILLAKTKTPSTTGGAVKNTVTLIFFADWVHSNLQLKYDVEIGKDVGQYWFDLQELEDVIAAERKQRLEREAGGQQSTAGRSEATPAAVSAS